jgi:hypothetical protein
MTAGRPKRTNGYYPKPTRHRTIRRSGRPMPAHPSVAPVTMRAATEGPSRLAGGLVALRARYGRAAYRRAHISPTYCGVPERIIGEVSNHRQRFAYVLLSVIFMRLDQTRNQGLGDLTEAILVGRASSLASVFGLANAAHFANATFSAYSRNNGLRQGF